MLYLPLIYKLEEFKKWHRSNSWYLWHPEDDICSMKIEFLKAFPRRKDSKKKRTKRNRVTSPFTKQYETETWLFFCRSLNEARDNTGKYLSREYRVANPENLYRGNAILSIHRDCYGYFVPRNRITRKVIVRLMISLTGTGICFPPFPRCNCKCDVIIPARYRLGIRLTG